MKKNIYSIFFGIIIISIAIILNINVSTRQCINYKCSTIAIPLYLKTLDFFDRHYNYAQLVRTITKDANNEEEKVMEILAWTHSNIKRMPEGFPVIDDHVWHIIIRGYGVADQFHDVFTTLCNYAGFEAFFSEIYSKDHKQMIFLSFVHIKNKWTVFDPYNGVYFRDNLDNLLDIERLGSNAWVLGKLLDNSASDVDYSKYIDNPPLIIKGRSFTRASIQSPLRRLLVEIKKRLK